MTNKSPRHLLLAGIASLVIIFSLGGFGAYYVLEFPNTAFEEGTEEVSLYIHNDHNYADVFRQLQDGGFLKNETTFDWLARSMKYDQLVKPGRYIIKGEMSNRQLIRKLRGGNQDAVRLVFNNIRTHHQLAAVISRQLMSDSASIAELFNNDSLITSRGFTRENFIAVFIPNTYEIYWNTTAGELLDRMQREYDRFWNNERTDKAAKISLTPAQVVTLASIVSEETNKREEYPIIAGLYINRLKRGMPLQADPTVRFALNDFTIRRVLYVHLKIDSPYNTYIYKGLPPGPIRLPSPVVVDAVLNYTRHDYLFMAAKETLNGEHNFARTHAEHIRNARKYQQALNARGIRR
jgi:UPF0755 protein